MQDKRLVSYPPAHASNLYSVPDGILHIGNYAFSCAKNLREICLPASIITIGWSAFCNCTDLAYINIPDRIHSLGDAAFTGCSSLCEVILPDLYTIWQGGFSGL